MEFFIKYKSIKMYWLISVIKMKMNIFQIIVSIIFFVIWYWNEYKSLFLCRLFSYEHHSFNQYIIFKVRRMKSSKKKIKKSGDYFESFWNQNDKKISDVHKLKIHDIWRSLQWVFLNLYKFKFSSGKIFIISFW